MTAAATTVAAAAKANVERNGKNFPHKMLNKIVVKAKKKYENVKKIIEQKKIPANCMS